MALPKFTIGIEEEYQILDPETRELKSYIQEFLEQGREILQDRIKPEFLQSQVEVGSKICHDMGEARRELIHLRKTVSDVAKKNGLCVAAASTHPFSTWTTQKVTAGERYSKLEMDLGELARRMLIFGMHVHIGIDDKEVLIDVMNQSRYFLPHILALSTSSPFWHGRDTKMKSYRSVVFQSIPRSGVPPLFDSWAEYQGFVDTLVRTGAIDEPTKIWWDVRPHPTFPTLEFRVADICTTIDEAMCVASILLALTAKLMVLRRNNMSWRRYRKQLIEENKWRAVRDGIDGSLIDFGKQASVPARDLIREILEFVDDVVDELGVRSEVEYAHTILEGGTSADRQIATFEKTGSLEAVVDQLIEETGRGVE